ncbi:MAG: glycosyltransferase [Duncaniella sp.]|nr:glycosyltransferase [Muribaculum sp.]MCM1255190.1 glycosyltransferase [Duncaniella sp.]
MTQTKVPEISIVVAVYKAEAYIRRCLDSILAQTFTDYEVIMVDDGSPDSSGEICEEYAGRDPRFKVIHKENGGVGSTRHVGMEHSRGRYSSHIDPDDWVEPTFLELLHKAAEENHADIAICNTVKEYGDRQEICYPMESRNDVLSLLREYKYADFNRISLVDLVDFVKFLKDFGGLFGGVKKSG